MIRSTEMMSSSCQIVTIKGFFHTHDTGMFQVRVIGAQDWGLKCTTQETFTWKIKKVFTQTEEFGTREGSKKGNQRDMTVLAQLDLAWLRRYSDQIRWSSRNAKLFIHLNEAWLLWLWRSELTVAKKVETGSTFFAAVGCDTAAANHVKGLGEEQRTQLDFTQWVLLC